MKKKNVYVMIIFFIYGVMYGGILNFFLQGEDAIWSFAILQGFFVGVFSALVYFMYIFLFKILCYENCDRNKLHFVIVIENMLVWLIMFGIITVFVTNNAKVIHSHIMINILNMIYVTRVVFKSYNDGKNLRICNKI